MWKVISVAYRRNITAQTIFFLKKNFYKYLFIQYTEVPIDNRLHFRAIKAIAYSNPILIPFSWRDQVVVRCNSVLKEKNTE